MIIEVQQREQIRYSIVTFKKYYINKETEGKINREEKLMPIKLNSCEILISFELLHSSKVPEDIELLMITS